MVPDGEREEPAGRRPDPGVSAEELSALRAEIDSVERSVVRRFEPGATAMVVAVGVLLLLVAAILPWIGATSGWQVLLGVAEPGGPDQGAGVGLLPRLFAATVVGFGVLGSALALLTRLWALAWVCAIGCAFSVVDGVWAIWSRQTVDGPGPGGGLVLAVLTAVVLAASWLRVAWSRP